MMQVPSSNHGTSRRSNRGQKTTTVGGWFEGIINNACNCAAVGGYAVDDQVLDDVYDDNSLAFDDEQSNNTENLFRTFMEADDQWSTDTKKAPHRRRHHHQQQMPVSPARSDATATTVLAGSSWSISSRGGLAPTPTSRASSKRHANNNNKPGRCKERSHSTGNIRNPEDEYQQRSSYIKVVPAAAAPREVLVPLDWTHEHGLRRIRSDHTSTYKLPFQTVQPSKSYHRSNN